MTWDDLISRPGIAYTIDPAYQAEVRDYLGKKSIHLVGLICRLTTLGAPLRLQRKG